MRSARRALAATLVTLVAVGAGVADAGRAADVPKVRILSPKHERSVAKRTVIARVKTSARKFRATIDGKHVTNRFRKRPNGVWRATLRRGRDFTLGRNALSVVAGKVPREGAAVASFRALRRNDRRLRVAPRARRLAVPVAVRVRSTRRIASKRMRVNGRPVRGEFRDHADGKGFRAHVNARHGLRYGLNRVSIRVEHADNTLSRMTRRVHVPRRAPIADAGRDRKLALGGSIRLDGSATRAPSKGTGLGYRWRVVDKPRGSKPAITSGGPRAQFKPDRPGAYRIRLVATADPRRGAGPARSAKDEAVVKVTPTVAALGARIQTITADGEIQIENRHYPKRGNWIRLLIVDSVHLQPELDKGYDVGDYKQFVADAGTAGDDDYVIITGQGQTVPTPDGLLPKANADALQKVFDSIGVTTSTRGATYTGVGAFNLGAWSVIGSPGMTPGSAWQNYRVTQAGIEGFLGGSPGQEGSLNGYMGNVVGSGAQFVSHEFAPIDTRAPGSSATKNVIAVGDETYDSDPLGGGKAMGVQVLFLGGSDLSLQVNATYPLRNPDGSLYVTGLEAFKNILDVARDPAPNTYPGTRFQPPLVVLQSFGNTSHAGLDWISDSNAWVNDQLPDWGLSGWNDPKFMKWCGNARTPRSNMECEPRNQADFPNSPEELDPPSSYSVDTTSFTSDVGLMAGMPARTAVANIGRNGAPEAVSIVGVAHPYDRSDVSVRVGEDAEQTVGTLRRTNQSQWTVSVPGADERFDTTGFWELAVTPPKPFPYPPGSAPGMSEAHLVVLKAIFPTDAVCNDPKTDPCVKDVRYEYTARATSDQWGTWRSEVVELGQSPPAGMSAAGRDALRTLVPVLATEFGQLDDVDSLFGEYARVFADAQTQIIGDTDSAGTTVMSAAFRDTREYQASLETEAATVNSEAPIGDSLYLAADLFDLFPEGEFVGGPIALLASGWDLFSGIAGSQTSEQQNRRQLPDYPNLIRDKANQLGTALSTQYDEMADTFTYLQRVFASDPNKLATAATNAETLGAWSLLRGSQAEKHLQATIAVSTQTALFSALMPVAYDNWAIAPVNTTSGNENFANSDPNTAGPSNYYCDEGPNPFQSYPASANDVSPHSLHWVRYEQAHKNSEITNRTNLNRDMNGIGPVGARGHFVGRGLKSKSNPMSLTSSYTSSGMPFNVYYTDTQAPEGKEAGASPYPATLELMFGKPTTLDDPDHPRGLLMNKDEFFGLETWGTPKLMCGAPLDRDYYKDYVAN